MKEHFSFFSFLLVQNQSVVAKGGIAYQKAVGKQVKPKNVKSAKFSVAVVKITNTYIVLNWS